MANKSRTLHIAVEPAMWREVRDYAQKAGLSLGTYLRLAIMEHIAGKRERQSKGQAA